MRWPRKPRTKPCRLTAGRRIYAVGDIHGRLDLLDRALDRIWDDMTHQTPSHMTLVFLGDYIDRGAASAGVVDRLIEVERWCPTVCLKGNHEAVLMSFLRSPDVLYAWAPHGGFATLMSYGLTPSPNPTSAECVMLARALNEALPPAHREFLRSLPSLFEYDDYCFVHAGIRPRVPLASQVEADLLWIRDDFLQETRPHEKFIVHGHSPVPSPEICINRINIDTGAYATSQLTCLVLEGDTRRFI